MSEDIDITALDQALGSVAHELSQIREANPEFSWAEAATYRREHPIRRAIFPAVRRTAIENYLPSNYKVIEANEDHVVIEGRDHAGWTLDGYVLPRLASGLYFGKEVSV